MKLHTAWTISVIVLVACLTAATGQTQINSGYASGPAPVPGWQPTLPPGFAPPAAGGLPAGQGSPVMPATYAEGEEPPVESYEEMGGFRGNFQLHRVLNMLLPYAEGGICAPRWYDIHFETTYLTRDEVSRNVILSSEKDENFYWGCFLKKSEKELETEIEILEKYNQIKVLASTLESVEKENIFHILCGQSTPGEYYIHEVNNDSDFKIS